MELGSFSLGSDSLGIGSVFSSLAKGTESCGARPVFPGKGRKSFEECVKKSQDLQNQQMNKRMDSNIQDSAQSGMKKIVLIIVLAVFVGIIALVIGRKSN